MTNLLTDQLGARRIGNDAGWVLAFFREGKDGKVESKPAVTFTREQYHAEVSATLPDGLGGGSYTFTIEGMTDEHYAQIAQTDGPKPGNPPKPTVVKLYLHWRDTNVGKGLLSFASNAIGLADVIGGLGGGPNLPVEALVAELFITKVSRKLGARRYEAVVTAQERVFHKFNGRLAAGLAVDKFDKAAQAVAKLTAVELKTFGLGPDGSFNPGQLGSIAGAVKELPPDEVGAALGAIGGAIGGALAGPAGAAAGAAVAAALDHAGNEKVSEDAGTPYRKVIENLATAMEQATGKYGRGMLLIRDGVLHLGPRPIPLVGEEPKRLNPEGGLLETEPLDPVPTDPNFDPQKSDGPEPPKRRQYKLTLKGRPDLKPGDVVAVELPPEESATTPGILAGLTAAIGAFAGPAVAGFSPGKSPTNFYVSSVQHRLGRTSGFVTTLTVLEVLKDPWDQHGVGPSQSSRGGGHGSADAAQDAAHAVRRALQDSSRAGRFAEVGEVRASHATGGPKSEPPSQTTDVFRGLAQPDGRAHQGRRLPIRRTDPSPVDGVAYASPFAWGKCGLVLPRYPGTRVVLVHRNGQSADPIDVGALWESGHGPESKPGDYWLILPVDVDPSVAASVAADATPKEPTDRKATQDLIDAQGNRIIEVGSLTIRVGKAQLRTAGTRPDDPKPADSVTITHAQGKSSITMTPDGKVVIKTDNKDIELDAGTGTITMKAQDVKVNVKGAMDVSG